MSRLAICLERPEMLKRMPSSSFDELKKNAAYSKKKLIEKLAVYSEKKLLVNLGGALDQGKGYLWRPSKNHNSSLLHSQTFHLLRAYYVPLELNLLVIYAKLVNVNPIDGPTTVAGLG